MTIEYRATAETARTVIEATAAAARALFETLYPSESWDELSGLADLKQTPALARQAVFMRAARFGCDAYARLAAGIRHRNPLSQGERQRTGQVWTSVILTPEARPLRQAGNVAATHIQRYDPTAAALAATGGRGAVTAMIRDYSIALARLSAAV
ncbi:MAG: hypothetical protein IPK75_12740 [Acidobacteria bacterium]|nr:hypothetical protein [Acidobacteriota bacterium]